MMGRSTRSRSPYYRLFATLDLDRKTRVRSSDDVSPVDKDGNSSLGDPEKNYGDGENKVAGRCGQSLLRSEFQAFRIAIYSCELEIRFGPKLDRIRMNLPTEPDRLQYISTCRHRTPTRPPGHVINYVFKFYYSSSQLTIIIL